MNPIFFFMKLIKNMQCFYAIIRQIDKLHILLIYFLTFTDKSKILTDEN